MCWCWCSHAEQKSVRVDQTQLQLQFFEVCICVIFNLRTHLPSLAACSWTYEVRGCRTRIHGAPQLCTVTLARSPTLPTFQVAENFALPAATASSSLRFTAPLLAAKHFRLLALIRCGTVCHWRIRRHRLWRPSAFDSRHFFLLSHFLTFHSSDIYSTHYLW